MGEPPMAEDPEVAHELGNERVQITKGDVARTPSEGRRSPFDGPPEPAQIQHIAGGIPR